MLSCSLQGIYVVEGGDDPYKGATFTKPPINALDRASTNRPTISINDSASALFCNACNLQLNSKSQLVAHMEGKKHRNKASYYIEKIPLNSILCPVCDVPVGIASMGLHEMGRTHIFKSAMANCSRVCNNCLIEDRVFQHRFSNSLPLFLDCLPSFSLSLVEISQSETDVVLQMPFEDGSSITSVALAIALGLVQENRATIDKPSGHCFAVWICSQKSAVSRRMEDVRLLSKKLIKNRPRLVNIVKDTFSMDDRSCGITQHEIAFSTPGGFQNLLESVPNVQRAVCALIFTDVELSVDNDPTERLLNHFVCLGRTHPVTRPRVDYLYHIWENSLLAIA
ncbi:unnamed protein product [Taenia asiatica]|uniref:C2H2-type domain-containing protein n=1 Tax=Taenia asiatica TaxID=60517 RepID=A0A0R3W9K6_TAEAS|nr:unnamed protein product [Taenia asiatica]